MKCLEIWSVIGTVALAATVRCVAIDHALFTEVLADHVTSGLVDYASLKTEPRLERYLAELDATVPDSLPTEDEQLVFWINAYNAYTLKLVADHYPVKSIHDIGTGGRIIGWLIKRTPWDIRFAKIGGKAMTLHEIEHEVIRPRFKEPRIHFAIVCAAISCPPLRTEAYVAARLHDQLDEQTRQFLNDGRSNRYDLKQAFATLSPIFSWFSEDFGPNDQAVMEFVAPYLKPSYTATSTTQPSKWRIRYSDYDWSLNERSAPR
jgi:hypothetical protein